MRVSKARRAKNRERVVAAAARLLRERGISGIGVDALAQAAGLTHGAIYSHFRTKDELAAAAVTHALAQSSAEWQAAAGEGDAAGIFNQLVRSYVSRAHRDHPGDGCALAAMGSDAMRGGRRRRTKVRRAFSDGAVALIDTVAAVCDGASAETRREQAIAAITSMLGAIVLARAVDDQALSDRVLLTVRRKLMRPT
jgi:TetR/AcrR family transcriptional regulator, transcriptional repressor for nem operon